MPQLTEKQMEAILRKYEKTISPVPKGMKKVIVDILHKKGKTIQELKQTGYMKVKNHGYMDLHVDYLGNECGLDKYAIAHNYLQNGDVMKDPDMMFYDIGTEFYAASFEQDGFPQISQISVACEKNQLLKNPKLQKQHQTFSHKWARNLNQQGFTKVNQDQIEMD